MTKYLIFIILLSMNAAYTFCNLNIRGDNICLDEKALEIVQNEDKSLSHNLVTIREINFPNITVDVDGERERRVIHIDDLSGNLTCEESTSVCKNQKVLVESQCINANSDKSYKIENIYSNDMIEIKTGMFFFKKSKVIPVVCVKDIETYLN